MIILNNIPTHFSKSKAIEIAKANNDDETGGWVYRVIPCAMPDKKESEYWQIQVNDETDQTVGYL